MFDWIKAWWNELKQWFQEIWNSVVEFFTDLPIEALDGFLSALAGLIESISIPDFLSNGLQPVFSAMGPEITFFVVQFRIAEGLALLGLAVLFRMTRKLLTLFQW